MLFLKTVWMIENKKITLARGFLLCYNHFVSNEYVGKYEKIDIKNSKLHIKNIDCGWTTSHKWLISNAKTEVGGDFFE